MNALGELPARQTALAAQSLEVAVDIRGGELLDRAADLGLNEILEVLHLAAPAALGDAGPVEADQVVFEKACGGIGRNYGGNLNWRRSLSMLKDILPGEVELG